MVTSHFKLIRPCSKNPSNLKRKTKSMNAYIYIGLLRLRYEMPTTHGKQHPLSTAEGFLKTIKIFWKVAHPWLDSNPRPPDYMPSIHMCINAYTYVYLWVQWHHYIQFFVNIHIKLDKHARQTPKGIIWWEMIYVINRPQNERVPLILPLASLFFWTQHTSKPLYTKFGAFRRKWTSFCHISATLNMLCDVLV